MAAKKIKTKKAQKPTSTAKLEGKPKKSASTKAIPKKSGTARAADAKKPAHKKTEVKRPKTADQASIKTSSQKKKKTNNISPEQRYVAVQEEAYYIAERGNWELDPATCWAEAEKEIAKKFGK